jgi:thiol-disulfide isomerase/thioredoxin
MTTVSGLLFALVTAASPAPRGEVLDFSAKWCGPCQQVAPLVARLERDGFPIRSVDVDQHRDLAERFKVTAMPTFILLVDGREVDRHTGKMDEAQLRAWMDRIPTQSTAPLIATNNSAGGGAAPFVADSNVRLGSPQALPRASPPAVVPAVREEFAREMPAVQPAAPRTDLAVAPAIRRPDIDVRASDSPLIEPAAPQPPQSSPMASSARLRVTIDGKINLGSGTVIASSGNTALIMTCGHIFRGMTESGNGQIEVNLFRGNAEPSFLGKLIKFDLESDVGLVSIETPQPLTSVHVARDVQRAREQEGVLSIGCSGGQPPTAEDLVVTAVNPYLGPDNLECTGVPVQGRSGGGLFKSTGELVGICIAADPQRKRGVYAGLLAIHELLAEAGYSSLFRTPDVAPETTLVANETVPLQRADAQLAAATQPAAAPAGSSLLDSLSSTSDWPGQSAPGSFPFAEIARRDDAVRTPLAGSPIQLGPEASDSEIVCIIRPRNQPESASQVVIIHQASPKLLSYLRGEMGTTTGGSGGLLSSGAVRRSRDESVPTMGVSPTRPMTPAVEELRPGAASISQKPSLQATALTATAFPRRYVRSR